MAEARERLAAARAALAGGFTSTAISAAYYAMLYAARAALSEDVYAKRRTRAHGTSSSFRSSSTAASIGRSSPQFGRSSDYDLRPTTTPSR